MSTVARQLSHLVFFLPLPLTNLPSLFHFCLLLAAHSNFNQFSKHPPSLLSPFFLPPWEEAPSPHHHAVHPGLKGIFIKSRPVSKFRLDLYDEDYT